MKCLACTNTIKNWNGQDQKCAFLSGIFSENNWSCATLSKLRKTILEICDGQVSVPGFDYKFIDDENIFYIIIKNVDTETDNFALWGNWYKNRGCTQQLWLLSDLKPQSPTENDILTIVEYLNSFLKPKGK